MTILSVAKSTQAALTATLTGLQADTKVADAKHALKALDKANSTALSGLQVELPIGTEPTLDYLLYSACHVEELAKARSKADLIAAIDARCAELLMLVLKSDAASPEQAEESASCVTRLQELELIISTELANAANSSIAVGKALAEAREEFEKQQDFISWAFDKFSIRKSQAFNLMNVAKNFGNDDRFTGVAMRVLNMLAGEPDDVIEKAAALAAQGKLDTPALKSIIGGKTEPAQTATEQKPATKQPEQAEEPEQLPEAAKTTQGESAALAKLTAQLEKVLQENERLTATLAALTKKGKKASLPMLPHFRSSDYALRLGLTQDGATQEAVRAAYRDITLHYNPDTNPEAFELLTEAFNFITKKAKAA